MSQTSIRILSLIVGAVLATFGLIKNDLLLIIPAIIISPIGAVLNDIAYHSVYLQIYGILFNLMMLVVMGVVSFLIGIKLGKVQKIDKAHLRKYEEFEKSGWLHAGLGVMLGMFTAYLVTVAKDSNSIIPQMVGIGIAITLLPPIVDMGLRLGQPSLDNWVILNDLKIVSTNIATFILGAGAIHYLYKHNK